METQSDFQNALIYQKKFPAAIGVGAQQAKALVDDGATGFTFPEALLKRPDVHVDIIFLHPENLRLFLCLAEKILYFKKQSRLCIYRLSYHLQN